MFRGMFGGNQTAEPSKDDLRGLIKSRGVDDAFLAHLEKKRYSLAEVWAFLQRETVDALADETGYQVAAAPTEKAAPQERAAEPSRATPARSSGGGRAASRGSADTWFQRLMAEGFLTLMALGLWLVNGLATCYTVGQIAGNDLVGWVLGPPLHFGITRVELYLWSKWRVKEYLVALIGVSALDIGSTTYSVTSFFKARTGSEMPANPLQWPGEVLVPLAKRIIAEASNKNLTDDDRAQLPPIPTWWFLALVYMALSFGIAIISERLLKKYFGGLKAVWLER